MRKNKRLLAAIATTAAMTLSMGAFSSCSMFDWFTGLFAPPLTDAKLEGEVLADFTEGEAETFFSSDGWTNGEPFNSYWKADKVAYADGAMKLSIAKNPDGSKADCTEYYGGEARSHQYFGFGDYEVKMKPSKAGGTASTFFTCTGNYDLDENGNPNPHDEIDIEFLGKDTTKIQFNYFVNGQGGHEYMYDLGFDASEDFHEYGYRWTKDYIVWFVDDVPVYKVEASADNPLPTTPGRILMNYWTGTEQAEGWMGKYTGTDGDTSEYQWVRTNVTPIGELPDEDEGGNEGGGVTAPEGEKAELTFNSFGNYTLDKEGVATDSVTASYTDIAGNSYKAFEAPVAELAAGKDTFAITMKNNGTTPVKARVDVVATTKVGNHNVCNLSAQAIGGSDVRTDLSWGGSFVTLGSEETVTLIIKYSGSGQYGAVTKIAIFLDSSTNEASTSSGNVTLSDFIFAGEDLNAGGDNTETPDNPSEPGPMELTFGDGDGMYTVDKNGVPASEINVSYTNIAGNTYNPMLAEVAALAAGHNTFSATFTNNGDADVRARIDVQGTTWVNTNPDNADQGTDACNLSSTGGDSWTDLTWCGTVFTIPAGQTVAISVVYTNYGPQGAVKNILFFFDSMRGDAGPYSGNVNVKTFAFTGEETAPDGGDTTPTYAQIAFGDGDGMYTVDQNGVAASEMNVTYTDIAGNTWKPMYASIADLAAGNNTFSITFTNNGDADVRGRVDLQGTTWVNTNPDNAGQGTDACNLSSTGGDSWTDTDWGGTSFTIVKGETVTITITYSNDGAQGAVQAILLYLDSARGDAGPYSGNITVGSYAFSNN